MDLTQDHKSRKQSAYWANLVEGDTGGYKAEVMERLIAAFMPSQAEAILDIGCGSSEIALHYQKVLSAPRLVCMDYDPAVLAQSAAKYPGADIEWRTADIFEIDRWEDRFDLVFMLDMLHEVYSFYGRPNRNVAEPIDHVLGLAAAQDALRKVAQVVRPGGGVVITDNVICEEDVEVEVKLRRPDVIDAVRYFLAEYPSRRMAHVWTAPDVLRLSSADFCILLTQYNKIKQGDTARWNVEKLEIHQYMTLSQFKTCFADLGFSLHAEIGTPAAARDEWRADFAMLKGLADLPEKRITLLATRDGGVK